jgi:hypothetical protein
MNPFSFGARRNRSGCQHTPSACCVRLAVSIMRSESYFDMDQLDTAEFRGVAVVAVAVLKYCGYYFDKESMDMVADRAAMVVVAAARRV